MGWYRRCVAAGSGRRALGGLRHRRHGRGQRLMKRVNRSRGDRAVEDRGSLRPQVSRQKETHRPDDLPGWDTAIGAFDVSGLHKRLSPFSDALDGV